MRECNTGWVPHIFFMSSCAGKNRESTINVIYWEIQDWFFTRSEKFSRILTTVFSRTAFLTEHTSWVFVNFSRLFFIKRIQKRNQFLHTFTLIIHSKQEEKHFVLWDNISEKLHLLIFKTVKLNNKVFHNIRKVKYFEIIV